MSQTIDRISDLVWLSLVMDTLTLKLSREILLSSCWENFKNVAKSLYVISKSYNLVM